MTPPTAEPTRLDPLSARIAAAQAGDRAALQTLVRMYQPYLKRLAQRQSRSTSGGRRPSDLVQDTLERAVRCLRSFQGTTDPELRGWLAIILKNVLIQQHRAASRKRRSADLVPLPDLDRIEGPDPAPSPSQSLHGREAWRELLRALHTLPPRQQEAVRRHLHGDSVSEIARALNNTPAAISCLLQRGGKDLQRQLAETRPLGPWFQAMRRLLAEAS